MFRFMIRDVLWLMVVVGLGCGWWISNQRQRAKVDYFMTKYKVLEESTGFFVQAIPGGGYNVWGDKELKPESSAAQKK